MKRIAVLIFPFVFGFLLSQNEKYTVGVFGGYNLNMHSASFRELPGFPNCCQKFRSADGSGITMGILFSLPVMRQGSIEIRGGYSGLDAEFVELQEDAGNVEVQAPNGDISTEDIAINHHIASTLSAVFLEPLFAYNPADKFKLYGGLKLGMLTSAVFDQKEVLVRPENVVFRQNGGLVRNVRSGPIPAKSSMQIFAALGAGYELKLSENMALQPEVMYNFAFTDISSVDWKAHHLTLGASFRYKVLEKKPKPLIKDTVYKNDTTFVTDKAATVPSTVFEGEYSEVRQEELESELRETTFITRKYKTVLPGEVLFTAAFTGDLDSLDTIVIEETEITESFPLLPFVFFPEDGSDMKSTGQVLLSPLLVTSFNEDSLEWNTLMVYDNLLNIVGRRMRQSPGAKLIITGCNNEGTVEKGNLVLSEKRAESVKHYLVSNWNIDPSRISVQRRGLPEMPTNPSGQEGLVENRRAELRSDNFDILKPVKLTEIQKSSNPPVVNIGAAMRSDLENDNISYRLSVSQEDKLLRQASGKGKEGNLQWTVTEEPLPVLEKPVKIRLEAENKTGLTASQEKEVEIQQLTLRKKRFELKNDKKFEKYALILFDFDRFDLKNEHLRILNELGESIKSNSEVTVTGYTDRTGSPEYNRELAANRANSVAEYLKKYSQNIRVESQGGKQLLYNNELPQGRSYCRTVVVTIETPIFEE